MNKILDSTNISDDNKKYIKSLDETKEKWSLAWRKEEFIIGIQTTSRMESLHAMVKKFIRSKNSLPELFLRIIEFSLGKNATSEGEDKIENDFMEVLSKNIFLSKLKEEYSGFAYNKCMINFVKAQGYKCIKLSRSSFQITNYDSNNDTRYIVKIEDSAFLCSCWYAKQWGIPCCHMFATFSLSPESYFPFLVIKARWLKKTGSTDEDDDNLIDFLKDRIKNSSGI